MISALAALLLLLAALAQPAPTGAEELPYYVGRRVCLECHAPSGVAAPCCLEPIPEHDRSYHALEKREAPDIALLSGLVEPPDQSRICLGCHATAADVGPRWTRPTFDLADGVQCEACHDAGSLHVDRIRAATSNASPPGHSLIRPGDRETCRECHVKRSSHEEVLRRGFSRHPADDRYKTPVNLAFSPDGRRLFVVCEQSHSLIVVDPAASRVLSEVKVGRRPHDAAVSSDGRRVYVTNRLGDSLSVVDTERMEVVREVPVGHEPHGVRLDPAGRLLYVANTGENTISVLDAESLAERTRLVAGAGPWSLALAPDGKSFHVTSVRPNPGRFRDPPQSEITVVSGADAVVTHRAAVPEANMLQGIAAVPAHGVSLFILMRTKNLVPLTRLTQGWGITNGLGLLWSDGRVDQVLLDQPADAFPDPMAIAVSPDGRHALVTSGGADEVAVIDVPRLLATVTDATDDQRRDLLPDYLGASGRFVVQRLPVGRNPRGVAFSPDGSTACVANALDDSITVLQVPEFRRLRDIPLGGPPFESEIRRGERIFHSAAHTFARQFSCRSCHPDGHTNGLTFDIEADGVGLGPVDNRTLRGIFDTAPFKWEGLNPTLHRQCGPRFAMFFTRMLPIEGDDLAALVRYMATIQRPLNRYRSPDGLTLSQRRGKAVFERTVSNTGEPIPPERRCINCHNTPYRTARQNAIVGTTMWFDLPAAHEIHDLFDADSFGHLGIVYFYDTGSKMRDFDAAHLANVYDSPPYLHNGAAPTLEEIWTRFNLYEGHGLTHDLTRRQFNDLIAYLKAQ